MQLWGIHNPWLSSVWADLHNTLFNSLFHLFHTFRSQLLSFHGAQGVWRVTFGLILTFYVCDKKKNSPDYISLLQSFVFVLLFYYQCLLCRLFFRILCFLKHILCFNREHTPKRASWSYVLLLANTISLFIVWFPSCLELSAPNVFYFI